MSVSVAFYPADTGTVPGSGQATMLNKVVQRYHSMHRAHLCNVHAPTGLKPVVSHGVGF